MSVMPVCTSEPGVRCEKNFKLVLTLETLVSRKATEAMAALMVKLGCRFCVYDLAEICLKL
jgi:hypothetical protein